jgi:hypothetical protein
MRWHLYKIKFKALSPLHIGYRTLGNVQRTRFYIPGRAIWGVLTANLTRAYFLTGTEKFAGIYDEVGEQVREKVKLSYFFPEIETGKPFIPCYTGKGLIYGQITLEEFERQLIFSEGQTAIDPQSSTAEDNTLHETEYISPLTRRHSKQVYFTGYIIANDDSPIAVNSGKPVKIDEAVLKTCLSEISVGGERKYGCGRLRLVEGPEKVKKDDHNKYPFFDYKLSLDTGSAVIDVEQDRPVPAHLCIDSKGEIAGDIEPLVGREWTEQKNGKSGAGQNISLAKLCWVPGSVVRSRASFSIGENGILV